jgi:hypothetical protein
MWNSPGSWTLVGGGFIVIVWPMRPNLYQTPRARLRTGAALLLCGLLSQAAASRLPTAVEHSFSRGFYRWTGEALGCLTGVFPFSLAEWAFAALVVGACARLALRRRMLALELSGALAIGAAAYCTFLVLWGFNYQRVPFGESVALDTHATDLDELKALASDLVAEANVLRLRLPEDAHGVLRLADGPAAALLRTARGFEGAAALYPVLAGECARPKPVLASSLLSRLGISGMYMPFTGEANVNMTVPDPDLPFTAAHEVAHQRGFAREDEANYLGALACRMHPDQDFRYSGTAAAAAYVLGALHERDRAAAGGLAAARSAAVKRDADALAAWVARYRGPVMDLSRRVNDTYLRTLGQREGVRSYGRMVDLLIAERRRRLAR